jgi:hypothetical protein
MATTNFFGFFFFLKLHSFCLFCRRFKALRALAILHVGQGDASAALTYYQDMLTCMKTVSANETLEAMNSFLGSAQAMNPEALITVRQGSDE